MLAWKYAQKSATLLRARRRVARQAAEEKMKAEIERAKVKREGEVAK